MYMEKTAASKTEYIIPARTKEISTGIGDEYYPHNWNKIGHEFDINYTMRSDEKMRQTIHYYHISQISLDARKLGCGADEYAPGNFVQGEIESQGWREEVGQYRGLMGSEHGER
jgi:hypothetical protein